MNKGIGSYNKAQKAGFKKICEVLAKELDAGLKRAESKIWHRGPVWFLDGNPIAGYWVRKDNVQLLFWSGQSFRTSGLVAEGKFKVGEIRYASISDVKTAPLRKWLKESQKIQWDYKNIVKRKGKLAKVGTW
jgi:hypothetical protein